MTSNEFWNLVQRSGPDDCWEWQGKCIRSGYGQVYIGHSRSDSAHRVAYELTHGPIARGVVIRHRCDNPPCCNPAHLAPGTYLDNLNDARGRNRWTPKQPSTHCNQGHEFTAENTYVRTYLKRGHPYQHRYCRRCRADAQAKKRKGSS